jgi:protein ImuB
MRRIVSLWLPRFPMERLLRARRKAQVPPPPPDALFALVAAGPKGLRLVATNDAARRMGLAPSDRLADARSRVPDLCCEMHVPEKDAAALNRLARWSERWSPSVMLDSPDGISLDVTGIPHLFGGEQGLLDDIRQHLSALGLTARLALAGNAKATRGLCRFGTAESQSFLIAPGHEAAALASLSVAALELSPETIRTLQRLGLKRIADLYPIPRSALAQRFRGQALAGEVLEALDQATGAAATLLAPLAPLPRFSVRRHLADPAITQEVVIGLLHALACGLSKQLIAQAQGATRLNLKLFRLDGSRIVVRAGLSAPSCDPNHMARLLLPKLENLDVGFGIDAASLEATETSALTFRQTNFIRSESGSALAALADRIANHPEGGTLCTLRPVASHLPERAECRVQPFHFAADRKPSIPQPIPRPLLLFSPPEPIAVIATVPDGPPVRFTWRRACHRVTRADGPERIEGEWWREIAKVPQARDYYVVEDDRGHRFWLFRQGLYTDSSAPRPGWFMHGLFP